MDTYVGAQCQKYNFYTFAQTLSELPSRLSIRPLFEQKLKYCICNLRDKSTHIGVENV